MTELAIPEERGNEIERAQPEQDMAVSPLVLWAFEAQQASQIAKSLARTSFVPASLRSKIQDPERARQEEANNITAAILAGMELGLKPMATMRSIDIVQGTPTLRAHAMRGLVQSKGHEIELVQSTPTACVMRGRRAGTETWQEVTWTIERATTLGLTGRDQWRKQPQTMLMARATGEVCRLIASDALYAMPYASEEMADTEQLPDGGRTTVAPRVTREEILRRSEPQMAELPAVAEPEAVPEHSGVHDESNYSPECEACDAAQKEADRQAALAEASS